MKKVRFLLTALVVFVAAGTTACTSITAPDDDCPPDQQEVCGVIGPNNGVIGPNN